MTMSWLNLVGFVTSVLLGAFYGGVVAAGIAVLRYSRHTQNQYPELRTWSILLIAITTVVMWIWPFSYVRYLWFLLFQSHNYLWHLFQNDLLSFFIFLVGVLIKPAAALSTAIIGVRLYERSRSTGVSVEISAT
jgi:hypothetical protein